ncbi:MAG: hypothetical protein GKS00_28565, partial [Alphaproteobacteria bacterium]|nr:hypothetical protein [Alphaproteobacteria bacterium]
MTAIRVFILTTDGPVEVQRITAEDPGVQSVICLDGKAVSLPVSPAYEAFVRSPTGVIESYFGHSAFRLDVSGRISEGMSWQLGVFIAHGLQAQGGLSGEGAGAAILTTGEVDRDLNVLAVDDVPAKLDRAAALIDELSRQGVEISVFLPNENTPLDPIPARVVPISSVTDAFVTLGLRPPVAALPVRATAATGASQVGRKMPVALMAGFAISAAVVAAFWLFWVERRPAPAEASASPPPVAELETTVIETRAPPGKSCAAVNFETAKPIVIEATVAKGGQFVDSAARGLCGLAYRVTNRGQPVALTVLAVRGDKGASVLRPKIFFRNQHLDTGGYT